MPPSSSGSSRRMPKQNSRRSTPIRGRTSGISRRSRRRSGAPKKLHQAHERGDDGEVERRAGDDPFQLARRIRERREAGRHAAERGVDAGVFEVVERAGERGAPAGGDDQRRPPSDVQPLAIQNEVMAISRTYEGMKATLSSRTP